MTIVGRLTRDAVVNQLKDEREVVNFSIAVNDYFKPKSGEAIKVATFFNCAYWISTKVAANLKKGTLVEVTGRIYVNAYPGADGTAKASLNCHVNNIKIHAWPKEVEVIGKAEQATPNDASSEDVPF
ncbi:single-stranded DNA-binding protein [Paracnuella aquatica]|uniref:single-stranded DNA-binding protein n=1 Tax=Paracnuella aquatica TaxID=2268757 RepID=UPI000DEFDEA7|nr:single-stranded DNA-binding protein [Paracnuella aquatica]RPD44017.1 single-stranded DNA-binding protein [Paracnuella aquatica]